MTIKEMKEKKIELGLTNQMIADISGVPLSTVQKVFAGATGAPRGATLLKIERAIIKAEIDRRVETYPEATNGFGTMNLGETGLIDLYDSYHGTVDPFEGRPSDVKEPVKNQGEYTLLDYYAMPQDRRVELIDGVIYDMAAPTKVHQFVIGQIHLQIANYIYDNDMACVPYLSPVDVRLDRNNRTMMQPDIVVICSHDKDDSQSDDNKSDDSKSKDTGRYIDGAPDFVVEVISPSSRKHDTQLKLAKYIGAGVREYWMIDPEREYIMVQGQDPAIINMYTFNDVVPVAISGGRLSVDFSIIKERLKRIPV